jgi:hypothetical protein
MIHIFEHMKRIKPTFLLVLFAFVMSSFSAEAQVPAETKKKVKQLGPVADKALVYVYRKSALALAVGLHVDLNKDELDVLFPKQYYLCALDPGTYDFWGYGTMVDGLTLDVVGGQVYYIEVVPVIGFLAAECKLRQMDDKTGSTRVKACILVGMNEGAQKIVDQIVLAPKK